MTLRRANDLAAILHAYPDPPDIFVETGTFHGKTTRWAVKLFRQVHTIELQEQWYAEAVRKLTPLGVRCYRGNSAEWVPRLVRMLEGEPVCWFLDAHFFHCVPGVAGKESPLPLWEELKAIATRDTADIVIVDDVHAFGTSDPTPEWLDVSLERIAAYFPQCREAKIIGDQAVIYKAAR